MRRSKRVRNYGLPFGSYPIRPTFPIENMPKPQYTSCLSDSNPIPT